LAAGYLLRRYTLEMKKNSRKKTNNIIPNYFSSKLSVRQFIKINSLAFIILFINIIFMFISNSRGTLNPIGLYFVQLFILILILPNIFLTINHFVYADLSNIFFDKENNLISITTKNTNESYKINDIYKVDYYYYKNPLSWRTVPWEDFSFLVLRLRNGKKIIISSLTLAQDNIYLFFYKHKCSSQGKIFPLIKNSV
jgi:hypothetical protein